MAISETSSIPAWHSERRPLGSGDLAALLVWTAAIAVFFWDAVSFQKALFYFDITEINYPYRHFLADEIRLGRFSRWCPGLYCGMPLYSESQAGYLHPLKYLLYPWMATWKAFNLDTILSVWLTGVGTYGWLRRHVGPQGALTGAAIFGLSGYAWAHLIHTSMINALPSVPLVVWAIEWSWDRGRRGRDRPRCGRPGLRGLRRAPARHRLHDRDARPVHPLPRTVRADRGRPARHPGHGRGSRGGLGLAISAVQWIPSKASRPLPATRWTLLGRPHLRLLAPRAPAHAGHSRSLWDPRSRHRLDGRLLPLPRDEHLCRPDRPGSGR